MLEIEYEVSYYQGEWPHSTSLTVDVHGAACNHGGGGMMLALEGLGEDVPFAKFHSATLKDNGKKVRKWDFKAPIIYRRSNQFGAGK